MSNIIIDNQGNLYAANYSSNVAIGYSALASTTTGAFNTAYGYKAFESKRSKRARKIKNILNFGNR